MHLIGNLYLQQNEYADALAHYQKAMIANVPDFNELDEYANPTGESYYNADVLLNSLLLKARALETRHLGKTLKGRDLSEALTALENCDHLIERIRRLRVNKRDKIALGVTAAEVYEDAIRISLMLSDITFKKSTTGKKAFLFFRAEQGRRVTGYHFRYRC
ncbi:MAG: hypothetical protein HC880_02835 [Bacteroidia bacterium]|nr:hypothetical protein [Bacteroidia bacterium]